MTDDIFANFDSHTLCWSCRSTRRIPVTRSVLGFYNIAISTRLSTIEAVSSVAPIKMVARTICSPKCVASSVVLGDGILEEESLSANWECTCGTMPLRGTKTSARGNTTATIQTRVLTHRLPTVYSGPVRWTTTFVRRRAVCSIPACL